jgi:tetratricopeptide (TPR) repeat protein
MGASGLYLILSGRKVVGNVTDHVAVGINAVLIMACAVMAWRYAVARDFSTHRRWALRLFLVVGGVWFFRVGLMFWLFLNKGPVGFDPATFQGPFITFLSFAQYLLPLAVLELYLRTQDRAGALRRIAMAAGLFALTVAMSVGIFGTTMGMWLPRIKVASDPRKSLAEILSATIASSGIEQAAKQYRDIKVAEPATYNFDEGELDALGYQLIQVRKYKEAIRVFQLNVEAYPQSSNTYDSLGEAYMDDGDKLQAIANYQKSLQLNPKNHNAVRMLQKLNAP